MNHFVFCQKGRFSALGNCLAHEQHIGDCVKHGYKSYRDLDRLPRVADVSSRTGALMLRYGQEAWLSKESWPVRALVWMAMWWARD